MPFLTTPERHRQPGRRILLVSYYPPTRRHAGGLRLLDLYSLMRRLEPSLQIDLVTCSDSMTDELTEADRSIFERVFLLPVKCFDVRGLIDAGIVNNAYDIADFQYWQSGRLIDGFRRRQPARIIFSPMESNARAFLTDLRMLGRATALRPLLEHAAIGTLELYYSWKADAVQCVSRPDAATIAACLPRTHVVTVETGLSAIEFPRLARRGPVQREPGAARELVFVAYFGSSNNVDALFWYLHNVHPELCRDVPGYRFVVVGRGSETLGLRADEHLEIRGEVESIEEHLLRATVGIAPAFSGAGFRGKIVQYAAAALPCVASPLAVDGLAFVDRESVLIAKDAKSFIDDCTALLTSDGFNTLIGEAARKVCMSEYLWENRVPIIARLYELSTALKQTGEFS